MLWFFKFYIMIDSRISVFVFLIVKIQCIYTAIKILCKFYVNLIFIQISRVAYGLMFSTGEVMKRSYPILWLVVEVIFTKRWYPAVYGLFKNLTVFSSDFHFSLFFWVLY